MRKRYLDYRATYITQIDGKWYAFEGDSAKHQVYSIGADEPKEGRWMANWTDAGIQYVASPSTTRRAAYQKARRHGVYSGEV